MSEINWSDHYFGAGVLCEFNPREEHNGRPLRPRMAEKAGIQAVLRPLWFMEKDDPYPGEYALSTRDPNKLKELLGVFWVASGDVVVVEAIDD